MTNERYTFLTDLKFFQSLSLPTTVSRYTLNLRDEAVPTQEDDYTDGPVPQRLNDSWRKSNRSKHPSRKKRLDPGQYPSTLLSNLVYRATNRE